MALHPDFPRSPYAPLVPSQRWFPADETLIGTPFILAFVLMVVLATALAAQEPRFSAAVKGGATIENSEDALEGTAPALGITGAVIDVN